MFVKLCYKELSTSTLRPRVCPSEQQWQVNLGWHHIMIKRLSSMSLKLCLKITRWRPLDLLKFALICLRHCLGKTRLTQLTQIVLKIKVRGGFLLRFPLGLRPTAKINPTSSSMTGLTLRPQSKKEVGSVGLFMQIFVQNQILIYAKIKGFLKQIREAGVIKDWVIDWEN